ncbi:MAG: LysR family transcriptional regulator [Proteobacteria bacterium]|nr:LysR family transcriptional regulator [Pseudomonadota bacterium]
MSSEQFGIPEVSLRHLKSALFVTEHRNVTRAANKLNRSQTAVTKAISELESSLDAKLFNRCSTGMMPTAYGEALAHRVALAVAEFESAGEAYHEFKPNTRNYQSIPIFSMDISYKRLAAFIALYETRDVGGAANNLGVTKAAVYNSIRQMEELLELELFQREPNGVAPTSFCHTLARHTKLAFSQIRHAMADIANLNGITQGSVVIGTLPYTRTFLTPRAINRLLAEHPQLDVSTHEGPYSIMEASLRSGDIDFIVGAIRPSEAGSDITTETLFEDRLSVIVRKDHPLINRKKIHFKDLQDLQWVLPGKQAPARQLFDETLARHGMHLPEHSVQTSSLSMVRGLLLDSDRVALLSEHQIYYDKMYGVLAALPVDLEDTYRPIGVTMRAHTQPSPAARLFLEQLRTVAKEITV